MRPVPIDYARPFAGARWIDVLPRNAACPELPAQVLLHAGPPFRGSPPAPVTHAAIQALIFEGMAEDERAAARLLGEGHVRLQPAQDHGVVTPLAQVVSASMPLLAVELGAHVAFAPLVEGPAPALRFGSLAPACRQALQDLADWVRMRLAPRVRQHPVAIDEIIASALAQGDECHARTLAANDALAARIAGLAAADAQRLRALPVFVLPLLMAAASTVLRARGGPVLGLGGNGLAFGIRRSGADGQVRWDQQPAQAPQGPRAAGHETTVALAAIGDSAVIDFCGLGGQALAAAPALVAEWQSILPADALTRRARIVDPASGIVDARRIAACGLGPLINLAILDRAGQAGLIGRGCFSPPPALFALAPAGSRAADAPA